jgi:hypothetical protein
MQEAEQEGRSATQTGKATINQAPHFGRIGREHVRQCVLDMPMAVFLGIELRRIFGQRLDLYFWMLEKVAQRFGAGMNRRMVTHQNEAFRQMTSNMLQRFNHVSALHATDKVSFEDPARPSQPRGGGQDPPIARHTPNDWPLSTRRPSPAQTLQKRPAKFIIKHYVDAKSPRLFLSAANRVPARHGLPLPRAPEPGAKAVGGSSPTHRANGTSDCDDT